MAKDKSRAAIFAAEAKAKDIYWREHYPHVDTLMGQEPRVVDTPVALAHFFQVLGQQERVGFDLETYSDDKKVRESAEERKLKYEAVKKEFNLCPHRGAVAWMIFTMGDTYQSWLLDIPKLTGLKPWTGGPVDSTKRRECLPVLEPLKQWFESEDRAVIYGANLKFDWRFLMALGIYPSRSRIFDVQNAHHLLTCGEPTFEAAYRNLKHLAACYLKIYIPKDEQAGDWGERLTASKKSYMHGDGLAPLKVGEIMREQIIRDKPRTGNGLTVVTNISMQGIYAFAEMEYVGCPVNEDAFKALEAEADAKEKACLKKLEKAASQSLFEKEGRRLQRDFVGVFEVNFDSPAQCVAFFKRIGIPVQVKEKTGKESVDADLLRQLEDPHPLVPIYLEWKDAKTEVKAVRSYRASINPATGRIHPSFDQLGTDSGRSSCASPNMQNPSRKAGIRECVEERPDRELATADYSQMEVVIMTGECRCPEMLRVNQEKTDFHFNTAERVLGKPRSKISKNERNYMKPLCFGLLYGMQSIKLVPYAKATFNVTFTEDEAVDKGEKFFDTYPGLRSHHSRLRQKVRDVRYPSGYGVEDKDARIVVRNKAGRRRVLWGSNLALQAMANQPVQSLGADIAVLAMSRLRSELDKEGLFDCFQINFIHDELVLSCPSGSGEKALKVLIRVMLEAASEFYPELNFAAEGGVAQSWSESKG